jgi:hypothetical protein
MSYCLARIDIGQSKRTYSSQRNIITRPNEFDQFPTLHKPSPAEERRGQELAAELRETRSRREMRVIDDARSRPACRSAAVFTEQMQIHRLMRTDGLHMDLHTQLRFSSRVELSGVSESFVPL